MTPAAPADDPVDEYLALNTLVAVHGDTEPDVTLSLLACAGRLVDEVQARRATGPAPRTVRTIHDLDGVTSGGLLITRTGNAVEKRTDRHGYTAYLYPGCSNEYLAEDIALPATVVFEPATAPTGGTPAGLTAAERRALEAALVTTQEALTRDRPPNTGDLDKLDRVRAVVSLGKIPEEGTP